MTNLKQQADQKHMIEPPRDRRSWRGVCLLLVAVLALGTGITYAAADPLRQVVLEWLKDIENEIGEWGRAGSLELTATIGVGIIGLVVAGLQATKVTWARIVTAGLGLLSGTLVIVNQNCFDADHRAYRSIARQAHQLVRDFKRELGGYPSPLTNDDFKDIHSQMIKLGKDVADLQRAIFDKNTTPPANVSNGTFAPSLISSAYALEAPSNMPDWAKTLPSDADNIYFVGVASDSTAGAAREAAAHQAKHAMGSSLEIALATYSTQIPAEDVSHLVREISDAGETISTFVAPVSGTYRGYALVRVPRTLVALTVKSFFITHGLTFNERLLSRIAQGNNTTASAVKQANEQKAAADKGVVYVHVAEVADRAIGEVLRQALGDVVSAPAAEVQISQPSNTVRYFNPEDATLAAQIKAAAEKTLATEGYPIQLRLKDEYAEGYKTSKHQLEVWLAPIPRIAPRVSLEVENGTPPARIDALKDALMAAGYEVSNPEFVSNIPSPDTRLFYYKKSDAQEANSLVKTLAGMGLTTTTETASQATPQADFRPRHYDLRITKNSFMTERLP
jgi:hypothetical protein